MCRLFGFRSIINSQVHSSLVSAENTLHDLSERHPDGWGVAYYIDGSPHMVKSTDCAMEDQLFHRVSGVVSSQTVVAHIRKATQGSHSILNSHPFQYGKWIFAHNGNIRNFQSLKTSLLQLIDEDLKRFILGTTDSEIIFFIILSEIRRISPLYTDNIAIEIIKEAIQKALDNIIKITGAPTHRNDPNPTENYFSFVLTNGPMMLAFNGGQDLFYCTYKSECPEKHTCSFYNYTCENKPTPKSSVNHLILSSEKIQGVNIWNKLKPGQIVAVDTEMNFIIKDLDIDFD